MRGCGLSSGKSVQQWESAAEVPANLYNKWEGAAGVPANLYRVWLEFLQICTTNERVQLEFLQICVESVGNSEEFWIFVWVGDVLRCFQGLTKAWADIKWFLGHPKIILRPRSIGYFRNGPAWSSGVPQEIWRHSTEFWEHREIRWFLKTVREGGCTGVFPRTNKHFQGLRISCEWAEGLYD